MTDAQKLAVAQDMLDAWTKLDWERVYELFGDDGVLHSMMVEPAIGGNAIRDRLALFEDGLTRMDFSILRMGVLNDEVVVERIDSLDFNGNAMDLPVIGVMKIENGRVKEWREYFDLNWQRIGMGAKGKPPHTLAPLDTVIEGQEMSDEAKLAVAQAMLDAYEARDWEGAASLIADDGLIHYVEEEAMLGSEAMRTHLQRIGPALTRVEFKMRSMGVIDGAVMIERIDEFDFKGHTAATPVYGTMEIADNKIKVWREYFDQQQMLRGMGLAG